VLGEFAGEPIEKKPSLRVTERLLNEFALGRLEKCRITGGRESAIALDKKFEAFTILLGAIGSQRK
jgi:hypothetical protein